jgi:hypothetical protein
MVMVEGGTHLYSGNMQLLQVRGRVATQLPQQILDFHGAKAAMESTTVNSRSSAPKILSSGRVRTELHSYHIYKDLKLRS